MHAIYSHTENTYIHKSESNRSEMGPVRQNPIPWECTDKITSRKNYVIAPRVANVCQKEYLPEREYWEHNREEIFVPAVAQNQNLTYN